MKIKVVHTHDKRINRLRPFLYGVAALLIIVLVMSFLVEWYLERMVQDAIEKQQSEISVQIEDLDVDLLSRSIELNGIKVFPRDNQSHIMRIKGILINKFRILPFLIKKNIHLSSIGIINPEFKGDAGYFIAKLRESSGKDSLEIEKGSGINKIILNSIYIDNFIVDVINVPSVFDTVVFQDMDFSIRALEFDFQDTMNAPGFSFEKFTLKMAGAKVVPKGVMYSFDLSSLFINTQDSIIAVDSFLLVPHYSEKDFGWKNKKQTDRFSISLPALSLEGIDFDKMLLSKEANIRRLNIEKPDVKIYRDKNVPFDFTNFPLLPQSAINKIKVPLAIDLIRINDAHINYKELVENGIVPGNVTLSGFDIRVVNAHNRISRNIPSNDMLIYGSGRLYDAGDLSVNITMPMDVEKDTFSFHGTLGSMAVVPVNEMAVPNGKILLKSGSVESVVFSAEANSDFSAGEIKMIYEDVKMEILKKDNLHDGKGFLSAIAQAAIVSSNPKGKRPPRIGEMFFERDKNKGAINFLWKTVFSGIKATINPFGKAHKDSSNGKRKKMNKS